MAHQYREGGIEGRRPGVSVVPVNAAGITWERNEELSGIGGLEACLEGAFLVLHTTARRALRKYGCHELGPTLKERRDPVALWRAHIHLCSLLFLWVSCDPAGSWPHGLNSPATLSRRTFESGSARPGLHTNRKRRLRGTPLSFTFVFVGFGSQWAELSHLGLSGAQVRMWCRR